jgi:[ribosomal protein S18]-alanine N-acetyltransferase
VIAAGPEHAAALAAIHAIAFPQDPWPEASFETLLSQPGVAGFIDPRGGMVLVRSVVDEAEILTIGAAVKRQGIGRALMDAAILHLKARNVVNLYLEVAASNIAARGLYAALGFQQTGRRRKYYSNGDDALIFSLRIHDGV